MTPGSDHVFCPLGRIEYPDYLNKGEDFLIPLKRKARAKACSSHRFEVNILGTLALNFGTFLRFLEGNSFRKSFAKSEQTG